MPSRLIAVPNGAAVAFGSGGNAGNGRIAPGAPARARNRPFGSTYAQPRAVAACPMVALYCATVPSMLSVSVTEITCVSEQSIVVGVPAAAAARRGAPLWNGMSTYAESPGAPPGIGVDARQLGSTVSVGMPAAAAA